MSSSSAAPGPRLLALWRRLQGVPGGRWLFARMLARMVPYTGTVRATVTTLEPGHATVVLRDRRRVRNHLGSVHAIALANVGELASGLATLTALPPAVRGIVTGLEVSYRKKARGTLVAEAVIRLPDVTETVDQPVRAEIRDGEGDVVAVVTARWRLAPTP